ncbi:Uncharacterized protein QTN25_006242 [Entamoeba marina]
MSILLPFLIAHCFAQGVYVKVEENAVTKAVLPGMIFLPVFILATVLFIIFRTAFQAIRDRKKRPLNPPEVVEQMTEM